MSDSVQPHPWDSPGKNTGVGCHFLVQCIKVKSESEVAQSCLTLRDPMDCSLPGSSVHGIFQARVLEWGAIAFSEQLPNTGQGRGRTLPSSQKLLLDCGTRGCEDRRGKFFSEPAETSLGKLGPMLELVVFTQIHSNLNASISSADGNTQAL